MQKPNDESVAGAVLRTLFEQRDRNVERGFYGENQIAFAYNSEKIEGSQLTEAQTRTLFETGTVSGTSTPARSVLETMNHFSLFYHAFDMIDEPLSLDLIKSFHAVLFRGIALESAGAWKTTPNAIGGFETTKPADVPEEMHRLLASYGETSVKTLREIADPHWFFENIHPFQDGNGRVGRMLMFRECLANDVDPLYRPRRGKGRLPCGTSGFFGKPGQTDRLLRAHDRVLPRRVCESRSRTQPRFRAAEPRSRIRQSRRSTRRAFLARVTSATAHASPEQIPKRRRARPSVSWMRPS